MVKLNTASEQTKTTTDLISGHNSRMQLLAYVERYERLQEEKESLADDQKEIMEEAKSSGFDTKIIRKVIQRRKMDTADRMEADALLEVYEDTIAQAMKQQVRDSEAEAGQPQTRNAKIDAAKAAEPNITINHARAEEVRQQAAQRDIEELAPAVQELRHPDEIAAPWPDDVQAQQPQVIVPEGLTAEVSLVPEEPAPVPPSELPDPPAFLRRAKG